MTFWQKKITFFASYKLALALLAYFSSGAACSTLKNWVIFKLAFSQKGTKPKRESYILPDNNPA